ncbi:MAG TPA: PH domain-containing protein [Patescibacteria group bacterium]|nr:PH domain-containing protein [Patescibacteria group bacterium]
MLNFSTLFELKPEERVYKVVRRHPITLWPRLILAGVLIVIPFLFLFFITRWQVFGVIVFAFAEALGLVLAIRAFLIWDSTVLIITSHRICQIRQHGFWKRSILETPLAFVQEIVADRRGFFQSIFPIGTLVIKTSDQNAALPGLMTFVPLPEQIRQTINDVREKKIWQKTVGGSDQDQGTSPNLMARINDLLDEADEQTLLMVESLLKERLDQTPVNEDLSR